MSEVLLRVEELRTSFFTRAGELRAVDGVSLALDPGETLALVGESGSGKTVLALSILGLVQPPGRVVGGRVWFEGLDLAAADESELLTVRGDKISMIFQEPMTSLNPVLKIGEQIAEGLRLHRGLGRSEALDRSAGLLAEVGFSEPRARLDCYPHELSGGMRQRVMVAMALACSPALLIADEPTTALDVTVQKQILELMLTLTRKTGAALLLITHNLGVVAETSRRVAVMYCGKLVEEALTDELFTDPLHPYTQGLLSSLPAPGRQRLTPIPGMVPSLSDLPGGCHFHPRCAKVMDKCRVLAPPLCEPAARRKVRCWLYE